MEISFELLAAVLLFEAVYATFGIHDLLSSSVERVRSGRDINFEEWIFFALKRSCLRSFDC